MSNTPINVLIDNESLLDWFEHVSIKFSEGSYCNSIDISISSKELWDKFDPIKFFGLLKLQVPIGSTNYEFLIEERNSTSTLPGIEFTAWGRSAQALLDHPYSFTVNDEEEKVHPWQIEDTKVSEIITYVIDKCCSSYIKSKTSIHWEVEDFTVYKDTFSSSHNTPIEIISTLAGIIGAELIPNPDGSLSIKEYSVAEGTSIQEYNDLDHIVALSEDIVYPAGYNSVEVNGYGTEENSKSIYLSPELIEDSEIEGIWDINVVHQVRVYYYHPKDVKGGTLEFNGASIAFGVNGSILRGKIIDGSYGKQSFTDEWVLLVWGEGTTARPNTKGETLIKGNVNTPLEFVSVSYECNYRDFSISSSVKDTDIPKYGIAAFYFSDRTNTATLEFGSVVGVNNEDVIQLDWADSTESPDDSSRILTYFWRPGLKINTDLVRRSADSPIAGDDSGATGGDPPVDGQIRKKLTDGSSNSKDFRIWGHHWDYAKDESADSGSVEGCFDSMLQNVTPLNIKHEAYTTKSSVSEELCFSGGEASLSRPYYSDGSITWLTPGGSGGTFKKGSTVLKCGYNKLKPFAIATVSYNSNYIKGSASIPLSYKAKDFYVHLKKKAFKDETGKLLESEFLSISSPIDNDTIPPIVPTGYKDIAIQVKDFATDVIIPGAAVWVDNLLVGNTNAEGIINIIRVSVGDHYIRITAEGYLDSDEDALANDTFTVTSDATDTGG